MGKKNQMTALTSRQVGDVRHPRPPWGLDGGGGGGGTVEGKQQINALTGKSSLRLLFIRIIHLFSHGGWGGGWGVEETIEGKQQINALTGKSSLRLLLFIRIIRLFSHTQFPKRTRKKRDSSSYSNHKKVKSRVEAWCPKLFSATSGLFSPNPVIFLLPRSW